MKLNRWLSLLVICTFASFAISGFAAAPVRINEFVANNNSGYRDENLDYSDWIELHNFGTQPVSLAGWRLTDDEDDLTKWAFPSVSIPANAYLIVHASSKNRTTPRLHTNFGLSEAGEFLALIDNTGAIVSSFDPFPQQILDVSYGYDSTGRLVYFTAPTPGTQNGVGGDLVGDTSFSHDRGFYDAPFDLSILTPTPDATIRYTTNGVPPTSTTGTVYTGPIRISGTTTIRAAAFKTGLLPSNVDTQTYIFLDDVIRQAPTGAAPPGWPASWGQNSVDYGMDPDVVNNPLYSGTIKNDLKTIPSFSLVMNLNDLFNSTTGIYANPRQDGITWERQCSLELINPDGSDGFQANAGIRIRGGFSRDPSNPKHAFRFFFRAEYGDAKLEYPLFGNNGASEFDKIDLRTFQNYSWSFQGDSRAIFMRDQFSRDAQLEMGHQAERGNFYHLYINGMYWGLFNTCERPEASYGETYFGGAEEDYDTIKTEAGPYTINATDGNMNAWTALYNLLQNGAADDATYQQVQGNNPNGTPNAAYPVYVDVENLIDYMILIFYTGNKDAPISDFLGNSSPNNWYGLRNRNLASRMAFNFFAHDSEHTLLTDPANLQIDRTGPFPAGDGDILKSNPQWVFKQLTSNDEFKLKVADRVHRYFFNNGLLTPAQNRARLLKRKAEIDRAVVGESARWGDAKRSTPFTRATWESAVNGVLNSYFPVRNGIVLEDLQDDGLYPTVAAPSFNQHGGNVNPGFSLTMAPASAQIYYTLDGTDPRQPGGAVSSKAIPYNGAIALNQNAIVKARVLSGGVWSALNEADFRIIRTFRELLITEIMYNPPNFGGVDGDEFEFIEFKNVGSTTLDVSGIHFTNGIEYMFPSGTTLAAGSFHLIVKNPTEFAKKYPNARVDGVFTNNLANSGEALAVVHAAGAPLQQFTYDDQNPWPTTADGQGFSLVPRLHDINANYSLAASWRASSQAGGSPGADDPPLNIAPIVINEILTHTDLPTVDAIELHNPTAAAVNVSGWFLTDDQGTPKKYRIPTDTAPIPAGGYLVVNETQFNNPGSPTSFSLSSHGDDVFLFSAALDGALTGYSQGFSFRAAANGISFGRYTNSVGEVLYPAQTSLTLGAVNSGPKVGPIVINEINYHPSANADEFIELKNITGSPVSLFDPNFPTNTWRLAGVDFTFPTNTVIPPNGLIVVSGIEPATFRQHANLPASFTILGPFTGNLQNNGELIELLQPDGVDDETNNSVVTKIIPLVVVDSVRYSAQSPWPSTANGTGNSIERKFPGAFGNDPQNWRASPGTTSPGLDNDGNRVPVVNAGANISFVASAFPVSTNLLGSAFDDDLPDPPAALSYAWTQTAGPGAVQIQAPNQPGTTFSFPGVGVFILRLTVSDGEFSATDDVTVTISRPPAVQVLIPTGATWKYIDNGQPQLANWKLVNFTEPAWKQGVAPLGYTYPDIVTSVNWGPDSNDKYATTYFRHSFNVANPQLVTSLELRLRRDDGAVVYLNGIEVFRSNMPAGTPTSTTYASSAHNDTSFFAQPVSRSLLLSGKNVIAIEVHQGNGGSSDLAMDFDLTAQVSVSNQPPSANAGADLNVQLPATATLNGTASDDAEPNPPGVFSVSWTMVTGPGSVSFANPNLPQTTASFSTPGVYLLRMTVTDSELSDFDEVQVTATGTNDPYLIWKQQNFTAGELSNPSISGDSADPDNDTMSNQSEYIAGTHPKDGNSYLHVSTVGLEGDDVVLRFEAVGDKSYTILGTDTADAETWDRVVDLSPQGTTEVIDVLDTIPQASPKRFYRLITPQRPPQ